MTQQTFRKKLDQTHALVVDALPHGCSKNTCYQTNYMTVSFLRICISLCTINILKHPNPHKIVYINEKHDRIYTIYIRSLWL